MYIKQLRTSIIIDVIEIITFVAIIAIHHLDTEKALFPLLWFLLTVFIIECVSSFIFHNADERWETKWKTPLWQIVLWTIFVIGGLVIIFKYMEFWTSHQAYFYFIFFISNALSRNIFRYRIVKRYDFDKYDSADELLSGCPEVGKYIK